MSISRKKINKIFKMQLKDKACTSCSGVFGKYKSKRRCDTCRSGNNWRLADYIKSGAEGERYARSTDNR